MARKKKTRRSQRAFITERYSTQTLHEEREYGLFWYAWLWRILRPVIVFVCSALILIGAVTVGYNRVYSRFLAPVNTMSAAAISFEVKQGDTVSAIGKNLKEAGLLRSDSIFKYIVQFRGLTSSISYGTYQLSPSMKVTEIINELTSGSQTNERIITIVPGWTCEDIANYLVGVGAVSSQDEFLILCNDTPLFRAASYALNAAMESEGNGIGQRKYALEGYLAPDTYRIFLSATPQSIVNTLLLQNNAVIDRVFYGEAEFYVDEEGRYQQIEPYASDLSMDDIIIMASMIEKEASNEADYAKVAAVFYNRLKIGMRLESDPTATYLSGRNTLILSDEEMKSENAYNTYVLSGLPAGPICNPSESALKAARYPNTEYIQEGYLYFCATEPGSGVLAFARTKEEHEANVARYRPLWEAYEAQAAGRG